MFKSILQKYKIGIHVSLVLVACIQLVLLPALAIVWRQNRNALLTPKQQTLCYPWDKFSSNSVEAECPSGSNMMTIQNATVCCGTASSFLDLLVTKTVSERYDSEANPAHVETSTKVFWNVTDPSYSAPELMYEHKFGTINVKIPGLYFVTSQLKYKLMKNYDTHDETDDVNKNTFRHFVNLMSNGTSSILLEDAKFKCGIASVESAITSTLGAVFRFDGGEELYVATSHPQFLVTADRGSFFSIHPLEK